MNQPLKTPPDPPDPLEEAIFDAAGGLPDRQARNAFLDRACGGDERLRRRIETLLEADARASQFLAADPFDLDLPTAPKRDEGRASSPPLTGTRIGKYVLVGEIGEGGMGVVYEAEQEEPLRRRVALKVIKLGMDTRLVVARFEAERQALALMDHPNIAHVFDGGATETGRPFFVMELIRGVPITEFCDTRRLSTRDRLELFIPICHAVQHAHQKGIIHRDLKPSNILVAEQDGRPIPKIIDFGIAKATGAELTNKTLLTRFHQMVGTPAYMSPEQARPEEGDIDTRTDIYSLGVLLYELLTGQTPLDARDLRHSDAEAIFKTIRESDPPRPSTRLSLLKPEELSAVAARRDEAPQRLPKTLRGDLDWIALKALEKDRSRRYQSANDLAADVQRFLNRESVAAAPPSWSYQISKFAGRHRVALAIAAAFLGVLFAGIAVSAWQAIRATRVSEEQRGLLYAADMGLAFQGWDVGRAGLARSLLQSQRPATGQEDLRGWEWRYLWGVSRNEEQANYAITNHYGYWSGALSHDGRWLAGGTGDGTVALWNVLNSQPVRYLGATAGQVISDSVAFSPDDRFLVHSRRHPRDVLVWDIKEGNIVHQLTNSYLVQRCAISPDGKWIAACGGPTYGENGPGELRLWDFAKGRLVAQTPLQPTWLISARFSADSSMLLSAGGKGHATLWSVPELSEVAHLPHDAALFDADFSTDNRRLATADNQGFLHIWERVSNSNSWKLATSFRAHVGSCDRVRWSPDGSSVASGGRDQIVRLWRWTATGWAEPSELKGHAGRINGLAFSPDGKELFSASQDKTIRRWDLSKPQQSSSLFQGGAPPPTTLAISPSSRWVARPAPSNHVEILEIATWKKLGEIDGQWPAYSPDERWLATVIHSNRVQLWNADSLQPDRNFEVRERVDGPPVFSPDRVRLVVSTLQGRGVVWNLESFSPEFSIDSTNGPLAGVFFGNDVNELVLVHRSSGDVQFFDLARGQSIGTASTGAGFILSAARARDGGGFALGETGPTLRVWESRTGETHRLNADSGSMVSVAWSPDGKTVAGGTFEGLIKLWNVRTWREVATLRAHGSMVTALVFSPDGRFLISASIDGTTRRWSAPTFPETDGGLAK